MTMAKIEGTKSFILGLTVFIRMTSRGDIHERSKNNNVGKSPIWQGIFPGTFDYQGAKGTGISGNSLSLISRHPPFALSSRPMAESGSEDAILRKLVTEDKGMDYTSGHQELPELCLILSFLAIKRAGGKYPGLLRSIKQMWY
jgi:hypothetical protein